MPTAVTRRGRRCRAARPPPRRWCSRPRRASWTGAGCRGAPGGGPAAPGRRRRRRPWCPRCRCRWPGWVVAPWPLTRPRPPSAAAGRGADEAGVVAQRGRHDARHGPVAPAGQLAGVGRADRLEQQVPGLGHAPADDDELGVEDGRHRRRALADPGAEVGEQLDGRGVAGLGHLGDIPPAQLAGSPPQASASAAPCGVPDAATLAGLAQQRASRSRTAPSSPGSRSPPDAVGDDAHVPELAADAVGAAQQPRVVDDATADAGADGDEHHVVGLPRGAEAELAPRRRVGVVLDGDGVGHERLEALLERLVAPREVGGEEHVRPRAVDEAGAGHTHPDDGLVVASASSRTRSAASWAMRSGSCAGVSRRASARISPRRDQAGSDLGAADVESDRGRHGAALS